MQLCEAWVRPSGVAHYIPTPPPLSLSGTTYHTGLKPWCEYVDTYIYMCVCVCVCVSHHHHSPERSRVFSVVFVVSDSPSALAPSSPTWLSEHMTHITHVCEILQTQPYDFNNDIGDETCGTRVREFEFGCIMHSLFLSCWWWCVVC